MFTFLGTVSKYLYRVERGSRSLPFYSVFNIGGGGWEYCWLFWTVSKHLKTGVFFLISFGGGGVVVAFIWTVSKYSNIEWKEGLFLSLYDFDFFWWGGGGGIVGFSERCPTIYTEWKEGVVPFPLQCIFFSIFRGRWGEGIVGFTERYPSIYA